MTEPTTSTPRSDSQPSPYEGFYSIVERDFARTLERDLAAMTAERDEARKALGECIERFRKYEMDVDDPAPSHHVKFMKRIEKIASGKTADAGEGA